MTFPTCRATMPGFSMIFLAFLGMTLSVSQMQAQESAAASSETAKAGVESSEKSEDDKIRDAIQAYLTGTSYNDIELTRSAFYAEAELFLSHPERELFILPIEEYLGFFANREKGKFNGREGEILAIDRANDIATAKAEIRSTTNDARYIDLFLLKKLQGEWKIISKAATRTD